MSHEASITKGLSVSLAGVGSQMDGGNDRMTEHVSNTSKSSYSRQVKVADVLPDVDTVFVIVSEIEGLSLRLSEYDWLPVEVVDRVHEVLSDHVLDSDKDELRDILDVFLLL
eukprot:GILI01054354.1.p1 GENE.GILI01054354.1~~GILI01054354.1.p1  ORF type:complete len:112 (-),score=6.13 GILI01054354.1:3-338(-)